MSLRASGQGGPTILDFGTMQWPCKLARHGGSSRNLSTLKAEAGGLVCSEACRDCLPEQGNLSLVVFSAFVLPLSSRGHLYPLVFVQLLISS